MSTNYHITLLFTCLFFINACTKSTTISKFLANPTLDTYTTSIPTGNTDTNMINAIYDVVATERNLFINQFDKDYPGERASANKELNTILEIKDSNQYKIEYDAFEIRYQSKIKTTWNKLNLDMSQLREKYKKILGHNLFELGEYGSIIYANIQNLPVYNPEKKDSVKIYNFWDRYIQVEECGGFSSQNHSCSNRSSNASTITAGAGHCELYSKNEMDIEVPDGIYQYLTFQITKSYCEIKCIAACFGGVSSSTATLDYKIKYNGEILNSRNQVNITCIAPIIWASVERYGTGQTYYVIGIRNENGLPGGKYTLMENISNTSTAFLFSSSASSHNTFLRDVKAILSQ